MDRYVLPVAWLLVAMCGLVIGWDRGRLPERPAASVPDVKGEEIAPDLALYCEVIARVRRGENYYDAASEAIPSYGFPVSSPLNWRLPTYAWVLSRLPCPAWIQVSLIGLSVVALALAVTAQTRAFGPVGGLLAALVMLGVVRWSIDGYACVAQEPWAATLIVIALAAHSLGERDGRWRLLAIAAGTGALLFRELALPFCGVACLLSAYRRRWWETAGWAIGIGLFCALFVWHVGEVKAQLAAGETAATASVGQWLALGGLDFVLLTLRLNGLIFAAPGWLLWLYLLVALAGLARGRDDTSRLAALGALAYVMAFAVLGRPENFYWGLLPAPLLAWGVPNVPQVVREWINAGRSVADAAPAAPFDGAAAS